MMERISKLQQKLKRKKMDHGRSLHQQQTFFISVAFIAIHMNDY